MLRVGVGAEIKMNAATDATPSPHIDARELRQGTRLVLKINGIKRLCLSREPSRDMQKPKSDGRAGECDRLDTSKNRTGPSRIPVSKYPNQLRCIAMETYLEEQKCTFSSSSISGKSHTSESKGGGVLTSVESLSDVSILQRS